MKNTDFNELSKRAFENAKAKGFHDKHLTDAHCMMLIACELAEAVEADRMGRKANLKEYKTLFYNIEKRLWPVLFRTYIKDTVEDELADAVIRLLDYVGYKGLEIPEGYITIEQIKREAEEAADLMLCNGLLLGRLKQLHNNFVKAADAYFREFAGMVFNDQTKMAMFQDMESFDKVFREWSKIEKEWKPKQTADAKKDD